jgi:hypothetical protein
MIVAWVWLGWGGYEIYDVDVELSAFGGILRC